MPFSSKAKGRMSDLLKSKAKVGKKRSERTKYDAYDFLKRPRMEPGILA